jgi:hypothetical protein
MFELFSLGFTIDDLTTQVVGLLNFPFITAGLLALLALFFVPRIVRTLLRTAAPGVPVAPGFPDDPVDAPASPYLRRKGIREKHAARIAYRTSAGPGKCSPRVSAMRRTQRFVHRGRLLRRGK